jgi:hypothetical protein
MNIESQIQSIRLQKLVRKPPETLDDSSLQATLAHLPTEVTGEVNYLKKLNLRSQLIKK